MTKSLTSAMAPFPEGWVVLEGQSSTPPRPPHGEACCSSLQVLETSLNQTSAVEFHSSLELLENGEKEWGVGKSTWPGTLKRNEESRAG